MLKIGKKANEWRTPKGILFQYEVVGTEAELAAYNEYQLANERREGHFTSMSPLAKGIEIAPKFSGEGYFAKQNLEQEHMKQQVINTAAKELAKLFAGSMVFDVPVEETEGVPETQE